MSTHREIEEVYLEDIIKIQKMTKSIVAEPLGEMQGERRLWVDMKFVERWATRWKKIDCYYEQAVLEMLKEAGISIKK